MRAKAMALMAAALLLASCGKSSDSTPAPTPPADAPPPATVDFSRPINALGAEPFWAIKIRPEGLILSAAGAKDITAPNHGPKIEGDTATWSGNGSDAMPVTVALRAAVCEDGATGQTYPFTATVNAGGRALMGCATYADATP